MRFPRHAERQGIAPESKFAEKKESGPREAGTISEIENCQTCPAFRKGDRIKLGLPGLLQLEAWHSWASKEVVGSNILFTIPIFMVCVTFEGNFIKYRIRFYVVCINNKI